ncbi:MAG TPA: hypothetical protein DIT35_06795, partial [Rhodospirillaceae bacterium]|nr:hypothetical protein [Rhodospirillaceae bacterium]
MDNMGVEKDQPAERIIDAFGGIRPMATKLKIPVSTVQGWKQRNRIPAGRMATVRVTAAAAGIVIDEIPEVAATAEPVSRALAAEIIEKPAVMEKEIIEGPPRKAHQSAEKERR